MIQDKQFSVALTDKVIKNYMDAQGITDFLDCSNEGEAVALAAGHWLVTGKRANVFMSIDGWLNALNFFTSWIMPEGIEMNIFISTGRQEAPHKVASDITDDLMNLLKYDKSKVSITLIRKQ